MANVGGAETWWEARRQTLWASWWRSRSQGDLNADLSLARFCLRCLWLHTVRRPPGLGSVALKLLEVSNVEIASDPIWNKSRKQNMGRQRLQNPNAMLVSQNLYVGLKISADLEGVTRRVRCCLSPPVALPTGTLEPTFCFHPPPTPNSLKRHKHP